MSCTRNTDTTSAMLCGVLSVLESNGTLDSTLSNIGVEKSGVSGDQVQEWFEGHKQLDLACVD